MLKYFYLLPFIFLSCAKSPQKFASADEVRIFPLPPEKPRIQYLTSINSSADIIKQRSGFYEYIMGKQEITPVIKPYGISIGNGKLFICDLGIDGLIIIDFNKNSFEYFQPKGLGSLQSPVNSFHDPVNGELYIADSKRKQIIVFDEEKNYITSFGEDSTYRPVDIALAKNKVYVSNSRGHAIHIYDQGTKEFIGKIPSEDSKLGKEDEAYLHMPMNITISNNKLYIVDFGSFNIKVFTLEGKYVETIGSYGRNIGQFARPKGIALDKEENLYVVDGAFENVQVFNNKAELLMFFGGTYQESGDMWLPANVIIDYDHLDYFNKYVYSGYDLKYLIFVSNQYGPDKINVYGYIAEHESNVSK